MSGWRRNYREVARLAEGIVERLPGWRRNCREVARLAEGIVERMSECRCAGMD